MKTRISFKQLSTALLIVSIFFTISDVYSQNLINPANANSTIVSSPWPGPSEITNAVYDGTAALYGVAWIGGASTDAAFSITDQSSTITRAIPITPYTNDEIRHCDIAIGSPNNGSGDYYVGIVYQYADMLMNTETILMNVYKLRYISSTLQVVDSNVQILISSSTFGIWPRIDIINKEDYSTPSKVYSDSFAVCWQDNGYFAACAGKLSDVFTNGNMNLEYASNPINDVGSGISAGAQSDIAGIERMGMSNIENVAYIVFAGNSGNLYVTHWNISTNTVTYNNTPISQGWAARIDGSDPYSQASNGNDYTIVFNYTETGPVRTLVKSYSGGSLLSNNINAFNITPGISLTNCRYPTIAYGPGYDQTTVFESQSNNGIILEVMDWYNGFNNNCACTTSSVRDYFRVDSNLPSGTTSYSSTSSAWSYNSGNGITEPSITMVAWLNIQTYSIDYKVFTSTLTNPFKPTSILHSQENASTILFPNPTDKQITLKGLNASNDYTITDITGRAVKTGNVKESAPRIDISALSSGMYILNIGKNDKIKFVKQ